MTSRTIRVGVSIPIPNRFVAAWALFSFAISFLFIHWPHKLERCGPRARAPGFWNTAGAPDGAAAVSFLFQRGWAQAISCSSCSWA